MVVIDTSKFNILDRAEKLTPTKQKGRYICPVCGGNNLTISKDGAYQCWNGCTCKDIRDAIAPWEPGHRNNKIVNIHHRRNPAKPKRVPLPEAFQIVAFDGVTIEPAITTKTQQWDGLTLAETRFSYGDDKWVVRHEKLDANGQRIGRKWYSQHHAIDGEEQLKEKSEDGIAKKVPFKGDGQWPAYRESEALEASRRGGNALLVVEGEPCTEAGRGIGLASITFQGSGWNFHSGGEGDAALKRLKAEVPDIGLIIWPDNDRTGRDKAQKLAEACTAIGIWYVILDFGELPEKGDIVDAIAMHGADEVRRRIEAQLQEIIANYQPEPEQEYGSGDGGDGEFPATKLGAQFAMVRAVLGNRLRWNELLMQIELDGEPLETDFARLKLALEVGVEMSESDAIACLTTIAKESPYHPVRDYLTDCHQRYAGDTSVLGGIAKRYFGTSDPLHQSYFVKHLIASCKRIFEPSEKKDSMFVLQSPRQGIGKSTFLEILYGKKFFTDDMENLDRDGLMVAHQHWAIEIGEVEKIFRKTDNSGSLGGIKAFLSRSVDVFRLPYGRKTRKYPRAFTLVGTTNDSEFLRDETGNRRFTVVPVQLPKIPVTLLQTERDRIWGAAMALYRAGVPHWLTDEEMSLQASANLQFTTTDPWEDIIFPVIQGQNFITTQQIFEKILGIEPSKQSRKESLRIQSLMLKAGWTKARRRVGNGLHPVRGYELAVPDNSPVPDNSNYVAQPEPLQDKACATVPDVPEENQTFQNKIASPHDAFASDASAEDLKIDDFSGTSGTIHAGQGFQPVPDSSDLSGTEPLTPQEETDKAIAWIAEALERNASLIAVDAADALAAAGRDYKAQEREEEWETVRRSIREEFNSKEWGKFLALVKEGRELEQEIDSEIPSFQPGDRVHITRKADPKTPLGEKLTRTRSATIVQASGDKYQVRFDGDASPWSLLFDRVHLEKLLIKPNFAIAPDSAI